MSENRSKVHPRREVKYNSNIQHNTEDDTEKFGVNPTIITKVITGPNYLLLLLL